MRPKTESEADPVLSRAVEQDTVPWYKKQNLRYLYFILFPTCMGIEITSGFDSQMINAVQIVKPWRTYFGNPQGALQGIIAAAYSLGAICSLPLVPWINERYGRRMAIFVGSGIMVIGAILQCASIHVGMYITARLVLGFGIPMTIVAASSLIGELGYPKERPVLTSMFNASYFVGSIVAAGITFGTTSLAPSDWSWRIPSLLQAVPSLMQMTLIFLVPESPRFLISKDRREEAVDILVKYHAEGDRDNPIVAAEIAQIEQTIKIEFESSKQSWRDVIRTKGNQRRLLVACLLGLFTQWSGNSLISYYLNEILIRIGITDSTVQSKINLGLNCWNLINATILALIVKRFARRTTYLTCVCSLLVCYICWTITQERFNTTKAEAAGHAVLFFIFAYSPCYNMAYNALTYTYLVELFPFAIRSRGISIFQLFGRGSNFLNVFVNPIALQAIGWKYLLTYVFWLCFEITCVWFLWPETSGRTLEELSFMFEGKELQDKQNKLTEQELFGGGERDGDPKDGVAAIHVEAKA